MLNNTIIDIINPIITIPVTDFILCKIFGSKARWFQLHSVINMVIVSIIYQDVIDLYYNPIKNHRIVESKIDFNYIIALHVYHIIISNKVTFMDYFHHILFIGGGILPAYLYYNSNLTRLVSFSSCGLTGSIEYFMLALVKHKYLSALTQKRFNSYMYNYVRYPLSMYSVIANYVAYINIDTLREGGPILLLYTNFLMYFNGSFYNKLTVENYVEHKMACDNLII